VAIKRLKRKFHSWKEAVSLRELQSLRELSHENIVQVKELIREDDSQIHFVFEYMPDGSLYQAMKQCSANEFNGLNHQRHLGHRLPSIIQQVLKGLDHMHSLGFCHRDIKPENLLLKGDTCKIADLGLARQSRRTPHCPAQTEYISTRWYRAPEILLRDPHYSTPVDIFALGCVMAEMLTLKPLFPGHNEIDQIHHIVQTLGCPGPFNWPTGVELMGKLKLTGLVYLDPISQGFNPELAFERCRMNLERAVPKAPPEAVSVLYKMLRLDPFDRPSARGLLNDPFFSSTTQSMIIGENFHQNNYILSSMHKQNHASVWHPSNSPRSSAI